MADTDAWMPLWVGDYLADTQDLTTEEHGAYLLLLMTAWRNGGRLPAAPDRLARIAKLSGREWSETWKALDRFFRREGDELVQNRLARELAAATAKRTAASEHGRKGARARHATSPGTTRAKPEQEIGDARAKPEDKPSESESESESEGEGPPLRDPPIAQTGGTILSAFQVRWERTEKKPFFKGKFDDRDAHDLAESINDIANPEARGAAWAEIVPAIERYMRTSKPFYAGHPFSAFVKDLAALRVSARDSDRPRADPNCKDWHAGGKNTGRPNPRGQQSGCPECKSVYLREWTADTRPSVPTAVGDLIPGGRA